MAAKETTDITLFVRTSDEEIAHWDRKRIVDALMLETDVDADTAEAICRELLALAKKHGAGRDDVTVITARVEAARDNLLECVRHASTPAPRFSRPSLSSSPLLSRPRSGRSCRSSPTTGRRPS